jgi:hypothetical protein
MSAPARTLLRRSLRALGYAPTSAEDVAHLQALPEVKPPPGNNWPATPDDAERLFSQAPLEMVSQEKTSHGVAGACKSRIVFPDDGRQLDVKWKVAPASTLDSWNNNPRKELACYVVQRWFLEPQDFVVPTVALRAVPIAAYRRLDPKAEPNVESTQCVLGTLVLWLQHSVEPEVLYDPARFTADALYAYHLSNFNVLAYLVAHRDCRPGNILAADDDSDRRVFAVDNGISFGSWIYNFLTTNWNVIRVPAIRRAVVERLRGLDRTALSALATLAELRTDAGGVPRWVPAGAPIDRERGVRIAGDRIQLGLTTTEIERLSRRIASLLERVDTGSLAVF